jgi:signal transduction histidine kinase
VTVAKPLGRVLGQDSLLTQALSNLLTNAVKFVAPGRASSVRVWTQRKDGRVRLVVEDNGVGISPEHVSKLFAPFVRLQATAEYEGTGIGLAIVKKAAERMNGSVGVESLPGDGSRFWIELPEAA